MDWRRRDQPGRSSLGEGFKAPFPRGRSGPDEQPFDAETGSPGCVWIQGTPCFIQQPVAAELALILKGWALNQNIASLEV